tara:strand:- start:210 stop:554 length:345 start_codon:yes stop_codon:yes gene_type:complete
MQDLKEDKLKEAVIDFEELRSKTLDEGIYSAMGSIVKLALDAIFGYGFFPTNLKIKGTEREANAFMNALGSEARYIKAARDYGLNNPRTFKNKNKLDKAVKGFEKATGLKWPFK